MATMLQQQYVVQETECSICMQNFAEFELIITELCSVLYPINILNQVVTSQLVLSQQLILCYFCK